MSEIRVSIPLWICLVVGMMCACDGDSANSAVDAGLPQCGDAEDNDGDGRVDLADPGCDDANDEDESDEPECQDNFDNDDDGLIDLADPACNEPTDDDEADDPDEPECNDGADNDLDGKTDLEDPGCASQNDPDESDDPPLTACSNGIDDDNDGFIDFPEDPGCGSVVDDSEGETVGPVLPQCGNGVDDDNDGRVDLADPGCSSPADPREIDPDEPAQCSNFIDDDRNGITDFPQDPGCSSAGDESEARPDNVPQCGNGLDDDRDGLIDYPFDPGCAGVGDREEIDPRVTPACADGVDNDLDGRIDYPTDRGCDSAADGTETGACGRNIEAIEIDPGRAIAGTSRGGDFLAEGSCGGRGAPELVFLYRVERPLEALVISTEDPMTTLETTLYIRAHCQNTRTEVACRREDIDDVAANTIRVEEPTPGDYYIYVDGASGTGGDFVLHVDEVPLAQCLNGLDDDGDGQADFPNDPGCTQPTDRDETTPDPLPACADGRDNDGDGIPDFPNDVGCSGAGDTDEVNLCGGAVRTQTYPVGVASIRDDTSQGGSNQFTGSCPQGSRGSEKVYVYSNAFSARLTISVNHPDTELPTVVYARTECLTAGTELGCNGGGVNDPERTKGTIVLDRVPPGDVFIFVDHPVGLGGRIKLSVDVERLAPSCQDRFDNDGDGFVDDDDVGCADADDEDERDPGGAAPACADGQDNDQDGWTDYPEDPGCAGRGHNDERDPDVAPECSNGLDDDENDVIDFPNDVGCAARGDLIEAVERQRPACSNVLDDDRDGRTDYPEDPGCSGRGDRSEQDGRVTPGCADRIDNDRDGVIDYPFDPGCRAAGDDDETDLDIPPACVNGLDDDEDGLIDYPADPGCRSAGDDDEANQGLLPQCANTRDDDDDGLTDWPEDPDCHAAAGQSESSGGERFFACSDGADNDGDGLRDLADPGCQSERDSSEEDPAVQPFCADTLDNDEDGSIDWPDDAGCLALGDDCEEAGFGRCSATCIDLSDNPLNCGACGATCPAGVDCVSGRCAAVRPRLMLCGNAQSDTNAYIRGPLVGAISGIDQACTPNSSTQALLITRNGLNTFRQNADHIRGWVAGGGILLTENSTSDDIFNALFRTQVPQGGRRGNCAANTLPSFQFNASDPFWRDNRYIAADPNTIGCGFDISGFPGITALGGWDARTAFLGYRDLGDGRVWLVETNWQDRDVMPAEALDLMAYMIAGGVAEVRRPSRCQDGRDNDGDGRIDLADAGCANPESDIEGLSPEPRPACADQNDNDGDGRADFPLDPGCSRAADDDEEDPIEPAQCHNGLDDDGDGRIDFPLDPGCQGFGDEDERNPLRLPACSNFLDEDDDDLIDFPADPGCANAADNTEDNDRVPACADGEDNDRDGVADWPVDPGCTHAGDFSEDNPEALPDCANGLDDDADGLADYPRDPGCEWASDPSESGRVGLVPACSNGFDDDFNGRMDWPDDPGCRSAADRDEFSADGEFPDRCNDGYDNDDDGLVDLADRGCENARDDSEDDPEEPAGCADGLDNDEDGIIDWPADEGCAAQGDVCEQRGHGICDGECLDLVTDAENCGRCGRVCNEGVECIRGYCGGLFTFEGIRQETPNALLEGWRQCHRDTFSDSTPIAPMLLACDGEMVMYGCRPIGQPNWTLLAMGERVEVFRNTGDQNNILNSHNGVDWYFSQSYSLGFVAPGTEVRRSSCDTAQDRPELRMCWHTNNGNISSGYRCGATTLNGNNQWERVIWTSED